MKIAIGSDHAGVTLKADIKEMLTEQGHEVLDFGPMTTDSVDYPDYAGKVAEFVRSEAEGTALGVVICGTGIGVSITANKFKGIRCALCSDSYTARLTREHNNSNIVALGARAIGPDLAKEIVEIFVNTSYEVGRHQRRIDKISAIEEAEGRQ